MNTIDLFKSACRDDWPYKIINLSYLLYAIVGAAITIAVGSLFSLIALGE